MRLPAEDDNIINTVDEFGREMLTNSLCVEQTREESMQIEQKEEHIKHKPGA
jgi:hypothetical protein